MNYLKCAASTNEKIRLKKLVLPVVLVLSSVSSLSLGSDLIIMDSPVQQSERDRFIVKYKVSGKCCKHVFVNNIPVLEQVLTRNMSNYKAAVLQVCCKAAFFCERPPGKKKMRGKESQI